MIRLPAVLLGLGVLVLSGCPKSPPQDRTSFIPPEGKYDATILRDTWGMAHNYGATDADAAYALAFSHCEDDPVNLEDSILAARGKLASVRGLKFARFDYIWHLFRIGEFTESHYEQHLSTQVRAVVEAYADSINQFAAVYPERMPHLTLPVTGQDVAAGFMLKAPFFYELHSHLKQLMEADGPGKVSEKSAALLPTHNVFSNGWVTGSNAWAVGPKRSADGHTRLTINSHQPWDGPVAWYEAHVTSGEGWNMYGGTMPGGPMIFSGHDENKGWCHTVNRPDLVDIYALELHPRDPNRYRFDGAWRTLQSRKATITVKLWGSIRFSMEEEFLWSVHGPVVRTEHGAYAMTFAGLGELRMIEQWFRMNKAQDFEAFREAMALGGLVSFNTVYADRGGNLYYLYNGQFPERNPNYDWKHYLPGNTSDTMWGAALPLDGKPQLVNPPSGLVYSCNNTPYHAGDIEDDLPFDSFPEWMGVETGMTNRAYRVQDLYGADREITREEFHAYKYDTAYSGKSHVARYLKAALGADVSGEADLTAAQELLAGWNQRMDADNTAAPLAFLSCVPVAGYIEGLGMEARPFPGDPAARLRFAVDHLTNHFGGIEVPWGEFCRMRRGDVDLPLSGAPDVLRVIDGALDDDGRLHASYGDGWYMFVEWGPDGALSSQTLHQYGAAITDPDSPHYDDQAPLFAREEMRPTLLMEEQVREHLKLEYRPGDFDTPWYENVQ